MSRIVPGAEEDERKNITMKLKTTTIQMLAGVAALSAVIAADTGDPKSKKKEKKHKSAVEERALMKQLFAMADTDKNGKITYAEFQAAYPKWKKRILAGKPVVPKPFVPDGDPCVTCGLG